jgi:quinol-cytochrome oxidoreductase complex cytochrome b subunit
MCGVVITLLICFFALSYLVFLLILALKGLRLALLWATGTKDSEELGTRFDRWMAESRERRITRGGPATLRGALMVLCWRIWKAYVHPIGSWRGEFVYPPKKDVRGAGDHKL